MTHTKESEQKKKIILIAGSENAASDFALAFPWKLLNDERIVRKEMTRAEAVERMARALHARDTILTTEEQWRDEVIDNVKVLYRYRAEAALDALMGK